MHLGSRAQVGCCPAPSFIFPFQPMSAWSLAPSSPRQAEQGDWLPHRPRHGLVTWLLTGGHFPPEGRGRAPGFFTAAHQKALAP